MNAEGLRAFLLLFCGYRVSAVQKLVSIRGIRVKRLFGCGSAAPCPSVVELPFFRFKDQIPLREQS